MLSPVGFLLHTRDPEWADVKLAQARYLLLQIVKFQQGLCSKLDSNPLLLVCGDYNSTPGDQVRLLSKIWQSYIKTLRLFLVLCLVRTWTLLYNLSIMLGFLELCHFASALILFYQDKLYFLKSSVWHRLAFGDSPGPSFDMGTLHSDRCIDISPQVQNKALH